MTITPASRPRREKGRAKRKVGRPTDGDSEETRRRLVRAAVRCFGARGLARTTLRDVATEADLTTGTLYHHYATKAALYTEAYTWSVEEMYEEYADAVRGIDALRDRLVALVDRAEDLAHRRTELMNFILRAWVEHDDDGSAPLPIPTSVLAFLDELADDAIRRGELGADDRVHLQNVYRAIMWGIGAIALTGQANVAPTVDGLKRLVLGTLLVDPDPA